MSWSISFAGTPEEVVEKLEKESSALQGDSKEEYDAALPYLVGLVKLNYGTKGQIRIDGFGHAYKPTQVVEGGIPPYSKCIVSIKEHDPLI